MLEVLFLLSLSLFQPTPQNPPTATEPAPVVVMSSRWFKDQQAAEKAVMPARVPETPMIEPNNSIGRKQRPDGTVIERDPNAEKPESRSASLDRIAEESSEPPRVPGFTYEVRFKNLDTRQAQTLFWEYQFKETAAPENATRRRFVCEVRIKPDKDKLIQVFSLLGPGSVINVKDLKKDAGKQFEGSVVIDRIEFEDGSFWQRKDWNFDAAKLTANKRRDRSGICRSF